MAWVELVLILALLEYLVFGVLVAKARVRYKVQAPAITGHEVFERLYRVQMNTLELLIAFIPALLLAAQHMAPAYAAGLGAVYLVGRLVYLRAYSQNPASRSLGFMLSMLPILILLVAALWGALAGVLRGASATLG